MNHTIRKNIIQLFLPIFLETLLMTLAGSVDTWMISNVSDNAAGAIGTSNTFIALFVISFSIISSGVMAVMTQYIGAKKESVAVRAFKLGLILNLILGIIISSILFFFAENLLHLMSVNKIQFNDALTYTKIIGATVFLNSLTPIFSSYLRAFGRTSLPMFSSLIANLLNVIFNAIWIFGLLGVPKLGVMGVALATVISKIFNLTLNIIFSIFLIKTNKDKYQISNSNILKQIIKIGMPAALETTLYNLAMTLVSKMINSMDSEGLNNTARSYAQTITNFSYVAGVSLAQANAIMVGWAIGEKKLDDAYKFTLNRLKYGLVISIICSTIISIVSSYLLSLFTKNPEIIRLCKIILFIDIALELGRVTNLTIGLALKTSGDALYIVITGIIFMFIFGVGLSYIFGITLKMMVVGCYIGLAADELMRGFLALIRWKSKKWTTKGLIKNQA